MNIFSKWTLRSKIIALVLFNCGLVTAGGLIAFKQVGSAFEHVVTEDAADKAKVLGDRLGAQFFERYGDVQAFALNTHVKELNGNLIPASLNEYVKLYGIYDVILVVDKDGHYVGSNTTDTSGKALDIAALKNANYKKEPWFQNAMAGKWTVDKEKNYDGTLFESIHEDPIIKIGLGIDRTGTSFTTTIKNELGETIGVLTNRAHNRWFETEMAEVYHTERDAGMDDAEITLLDSKGFVISNLAPKHNGGKEIFDTKGLFKENMFEAHKPAGAAMAKNTTGSMKSFADGDDAFDLVGFHFVDNAKWPASIGWTTMVHMDWEHSIEGAEASLRNYYLISAFGIFIAMAIAIWVGFILSKSVDQATQVLAKNSKEVSDASTQIASQATELSESATEQAAALQETVAAVDEISAMVEKNAEAANKSKEVSGHSRDAAMKGRETVEQMINAINEINHSNDEISHQMADSNRQLGDITKLINDIGSKTKVINEIVFQTKLLSFNASVEAARAGEYGKGFAVVAEEVGNLAQMSGNAAKEITEMLEQSVHQVESIVNETKSKVERLMTASKQKVETGSLTAKQCNEALEEILVNVSSVDSLVSEIAVASQEQSTGIREISKAVGQLEEVTQQNSTVAQHSSISAEQLNSQSVTLNSIVQQLVVIVRGSSAKFETETTAGAKVLPMKKSFKPSMEQDHAPMPLKKASGSDFTPSSDDPGFGE
jgi:methyl-accepting chemotaxis protein